LLPEKPLKVKSSPIVLTEHKSNWIPSFNHPWRQIGRAIVEERRLKQQTDPLTIMTDLTGQNTGVSNYISH